MSVYKFVNAAIAISQSSQLKRPCLGVGRKEARRKPEDVIEGDGVSNRRFTREQIPSTKEILSEERQLTATVLQGVWFACSYTFSLTNMLPGNEMQTWHL